MKITNTDQTQSISQNEIQKRLKEKFGDKFQPILDKKTEKKDEVSIISKKKIEKELTENPVIGDVGKNDPRSEETQEKLKAILKTGAFEFNERERGALQEILGE